MSNPVVWLEVMGQDTDKLRQFYGRLLSSKFKQDNSTAGRKSKVGRWRSRGKSAPGEDGVAFYTKVHDLEAAVTLAQRLGCRVRIVKLDRLDTQRAVVTDPQGNTVGLCADISAD